MDKKGGADTLSGPAAGGTGRTSSDEDAGPSALRGTEETLLGKSLYTESYQQRSSKYDATAI